MSYTPGTVTSIQQLNTELTKISNALADTLQRKPKDGNFMDTNLDMNSKRILNLPDPISETEPARVKDVAEIASAAQGKKLVRSSTEGFPEVGIYPEGTELKFYDTLDEYVLIRSETGALQWVEEGNVGDEVDVTAASHLTLAQAQASDLQVGQYVRLVDHANALYQVVDTGDTGGYYLQLSANNKLKKLHLNIENILEYGLLSDVATNTLLLQAAINKGGDIVIYDEIVVNTVNLQSNVRIAFAKGGKLIGTAGNKVFIGTGLENIDLINPRIEGVFSGTPSLLEHAIDLTNCNNVNVYSPRFKNIGGNAIRFDRCTDTDVYDLNVDTCGYLGYIAINCVRDRLHSGYVKDAKDPFSVQSKGGEDSLIDNMVVENPHSCGVIMNTNVEGGISYVQNRGRIGRVTIKGESSFTPIGTKGGVFAQIQDGFVGEVYMTGNTKLPQFAIGGTTDNLQVGKITVEANTSLGVDGAAGVGTVVIQSLICKGNQDRAARFLSGKISILGGEIKENGLANTPNLEFVDWDNLIIQGVNFIRTSTGATRNNIKLGASNGTGIISGNTFTRNGQADIITETGEFRVDCPNVDVTGNTNCFVQVTAGWVAEFEIQNGLVVENGYIRANAPTTGTWVVGDTIKLTASVGQPSRAICVATPSTFALTGVLS